MLNELYSTTKMVASMAVLCVLLEALIPQGKLKNSVLLAVGIIFLLSIAQSLTQLVNMDIPTALMQEDPSPYGFAGEKPPTHNELIEHYFEQAATQ